MDQHSANRVSGQNLNTVKIQKNRNVRHCNQSNRYLKASEQNKQNSDEERSYHDQHSKPQSRSHAFSHNKPIPKSSSINRNALQQNISRNRSKSYIQWKENNAHFNQSYQTECKVSVKNKHNDRYRDCKPGPNSSESKIYSHHSRKGDDNQNVAENHTRINRCENEYYTGFTSGQNDNIHGHYKRDKLGPNVFSGKNPRSNNNNVSVQKNSAKSQARYYNSLIENENFGGVKCNNQFQINSSSSKRNVSGQHSVRHTSSELTGINPIYNRESIFTAGSNELDVNRYDWHHYLNEDNKRTVCENSSKGEDIMYGADKENVEHVNERMHLSNNRDQMNKSFNFKQKQQSNVNKFYNQYDMNNEEYNQQNSHSNTFCQYDMSADNTSHRDLFPSSSSYVTTNNDCYQYDTESSHYYYQNDGNILKNGNANMNTSYQSQLSPSNNKNQQLGDSRKHIHGDTVKFDKCNFIHHKADYFETENTIANSFADKNNDLTTENDHGNTSGENCDHESFYKFSSVSGQLDRNNNVFYNMSNQPYNVDVSQIPLPQTESRNTNTLNTIMSCERKNLFMYEPENFCDKVITNKLWFNSQYFKMHNQSENTPVSFEQSCNKPSHSDAHMSDVSSVHVPQSVSTETLQHKRFIPELSESLSKYKHTNVEGIDNQNRKHQYSVEPSCPNFVNSVVNKTPDHSYEQSSVINMTNSSESYITDFSFLKCPPPPLPTSPSKIPSAPVQQHTPCLKAPEIIYELLKPPWTQPKDHNEEQFVSDPHQSKYLFHENRSYKVPCFKPSLSNPSNLFLSQNHSYPSPSKQLQLQPELLQMARSCPPTKSIQPTTEPPQLSSDMLQSSRQVKNALQSQFQQDLLQPSGTGQLWQLQPVQQLSRTRQQTDSLQTNSKNPQCQSDLLKVSRTIPSLDSLRPLETKPAAVTMGATQSKLWVPNTYASVSQACDQIPKPPVQALKGSQQQAHCWLPTRQQSSGVTVKSSTLHLQTSLTDSATVSNISVTKLSPSVKTPPLPPHVLLKKVEHANSQAVLQKIHGVSNRTKDCHKAKSAVIYRPWEATQNNKANSEEEKTDIRSNFRAQTDSDKQLHDITKRVCSSNLSEKHILDHSSISFGKNRMLQHERSLKKRSDLLRPWTVRPANHLGCNENRKKTEQLTLNKRKDKRSRVSTCNNQLLAKRQRQTRNLEYEHHKNSKKRKNMDRSKKPNKSACNDKKNTTGKSYHMSLYKHLRRKVPYSELVKLSRIAKPLVNTKSSGLTSVINKDLITPSCLKLDSFLNSNAVENACASEKMENAQKMNKAALRKECASEKMENAQKMIKAAPRKKCASEKIENEQKKMNKVELSRLSGNVEFHQLGLAHKTMLKPLGMRTLVGHSKTLKSTLNLGSMKNLKSIADNIKKNAKLLEKPQSIIAEMNKVIQSNQTVKKTYPLDKEIISEGQDSKVGCQLTNQKLASFHPKLRHKFMPVSDAGVIKLPSVALQTLPKLSVSVEKCDKYLRNGKSVNVNSEKAQEIIKMETKTQCSSSETKNWNTEEMADSAKVIKMKNTQIFTGDSRKVQFLKGLQLQQNLHRKLFPPKKEIKHTSVVKRGRFTMSTPTTFLVKPAKMVKPCVSTECEARDRNEENQMFDDPLIKACDSAKQCLLKRIAQTNNDQLGPVNKKLKFSNLDNSSTIHQQKNSMYCNKGSESCLPKLLVTTDDPKSPSKKLDDAKSKPPKLDTQSNIMLESSVSTKIYTGDKNTSYLQTKKGNPNFEKCLSDESASESHLMLKRSLNVNPYTSYLNTPFTVSFNTAFSSFSKPKKAQSSSNFKPSKFSVADLVKPVKKQSNSKTADAEVYHVEASLHERMITKDCILLRNSDHQHVHSGSVHTGNEIESHESAPSEISFGENKQAAPSCSKSELLNITHYSESVQFSRNTSQNDSDLCKKPFMDIPLKLNEKGTNKLLPASETLLDLNSDGMQKQYLKFIPKHAVQNNVTSFKLCESSETNSNDNSNQFESSDLGLHRLGEASPLSFNSQILHDLVMAENIGRDDLEGVTDIPGEKCLDLDQSCHKNLFEDIIDDFMQDENFMNSWPAQTLEFDQLNISSECKALEMPGIQALECSKESRDKGGTEIAKSLPTSIPENCEKLNFENDALIMNKKDKVFVSSRTPVRARVYRKRKYVKRFPTPMPRAKPKEKSYDTEKDLYEAAKQFLGDFNGNTKRTCRIKKKLIESTDGKQTEYKSKEPVLVKPATEVLAITNGVNRKREQLYGENVESDKNKVKEESSNFQIDPCIGRDSDAEVICVNSNLNDLDLKNERTEMKVSEKTSPNVSCSKSMDIRMKIPVLKIKKTLHCEKLQDYGYTVKTNRIVMNEETENKGKVKDPNLSKSLNVTEEDEERFKSRDSVELYKCSICSQKQRSEKDLTQHYKNVHGMWWCAKCNRHFKSQVNVFESFDLLVWFTISLNMSFSYDIDLVAKWLVFLTLDHKVLGSNPNSNRIHLDCTALHCTEPFIITLP